MKKIVISIIIIATFAAMANAQNAQKIFDKSNRLAEAQNYTKAIALLKKNLKSFKNYTDNAVAFNNLGVYYDILGNYDEAETFFLAANMFTEKVLGKEHPNYITTSKSLGVFYYNWNKYAEAEKYLLEVKDITKIVFDEKDSDYTLALNILGLIYYNTGKYVKAEKIYLERKNIEEETLGKKHPDYASTLNNLGLLYNHMGNYTKAEVFLREAKNIREEILGDEHPDYATTLNDLGLLYYNMGNYTKAESFFVKAIKIEKVSDKNRSYATSLCNLATVYHGMNDYVQAEKFYLEAKIIRENVLGKEHSEYVISLNNLGFLYKDMGNYIEAEKFLLEAKIIGAKILGEVHPIYASSLHSLGELYSAMGNYAKAKMFHLEAKTIVEKVFDKEHQHYTTSLHNLGIVYSNIGDYAQAENFYLEAKTIDEKVRGKEHPYYANTLNNLGLLYLTTKKKSQSQTMKMEADKLLTVQVKKTFTFLSEQQRNLFWNKNESMFELSYCFVSAYPNNSMIAHAYDNTLFTKGLLLRTTNAIRESVYSSKNQSLINDFEQLSSIRQQIGYLQQKDNFNKEYLQTLENRADSLDKAITQSSQAYRDLKADISMKWQDIQKQLKTTEAAIEFVHFRLYKEQETDSTIYAALVLCPNMDAPVWIPLCEQKQLEAVLKITTKNTLLQTQNIYINKGDKLYNTIWKPLEEILQDVKTIYYSPSGLLHKIAFNALPIGKENILLSDKYNLQLVSSTREIARLNKETGAVFKQDTTIIYGGLIYGQQDNLTLASNDNSKQSSAELPDFKLRSGFSEWKYLAGTKNETEQIVSLLNNKRFPYQYYKEEQGNEESFKHLSGTEIGIIHLATHGFFLTDIEKKLDNNLVQRLGGNKEKPFENPLLRSGLIMSGANNQWLAEKSIMQDGVEDGILTADEISKLNLTKTKLVVLSACETGLGDVKNSEGVFGLQRAFKLAGVESLIMSLWKVPDEATAELMTTFYQEWLSGKTKQNAFKTAQQKIREKYQSPFFWAAFVLMD